MASLKSSAELKVNISGDFFKTRHSTVVRVVIFFLLGCISIFVLAELLKYSCLCDGIFTRNPVTARLSDDPLERAKKLLKKSPLIDGWVA